MTHIDLIISTILNKDLDIAIEEYLIHTTKNKSEPTYKGESATPVIGIENNLSNIAS